MYILTVCVTSNTNFTQSTNVQYQYVNRMRDPVTSSRSSLCTYCLQRVDNFVRTSDVLYARAGYRTALFS